MIKKLYHGSENIVKVPKYGFGKKYNDYGRGFYCTESLDMAKEWGAGLDKDGYANCYKLDCSGLSILNINDEKFCILHWLTILLENRQFDLSSPLAFEAKKYLNQNFGIPYQNYDVLVGYRADDSYFSFAQDFLNGTISYQQLNRAMHLGELGQQFVLKSEKAFSQIKYIGYEIAECEEWYVKKMLRDRVARSEYFDMDRNRWQRGDIYITQILDEEMKADDSRL